MKRSTKLINAYLNYLTKKIGETTNHQITNERRKITNDPTEVNRTYKGIQTVPDIQWFDLLMVQKPYA